jgi:hypothetical protein
MRRCAFVLVFTAVAALLVPAGKAFAADAAPTAGESPDGASHSRHRPFAGIVVGFTSPIHATVDGRDYDEGAQYIGSSDGNPETNDSILNPSVGLSFGFDERFADIFSLGARATFQTWDSQWSRDMTYSRTRWDLNLEPRFWLPSTVKRNIQVFFGASGGYTTASVSPPPRRAYDERIENDGGLNFALTGGGFYWGETWGWFAEAAYAFHFTNVSATLSPRVPDLTETTERRRYFDHGLFFTFGGALGFGRL